MTPIVGALFFVIELIAGVVAVIALSELADKLFNLRARQKLGLTCILYVGLVAIVLAAG